MKYKIILAPSADEDLKKIRAYDSASVKSHIKQHLGHEPSKTSKSRIKRLRGMNKPQYRLRVGDYRIFYDVVDVEVHILAIVQKSQADKWLERAGEKQ